MSADVEELLGRLAGSWEAVVTPITLDEVRGGASDVIDIAESADHPDGRGRGRWWLIAACVLLLIGSVVALAVIDRNGGDAPAVDVETTTQSSVPSTTTPTPSTSPPTTSPTPVPLESFGDGAWWPLGSTATSCYICSGIVLDDGRVALVGATRDAVVELFDPVTAQFSIGAQLPDGFGGTGSELIVELDDGRLLLTGINGEISIADLSDGSSVMVQRSGESMTAIQLADGRVLLFGPSTVSELDPIANQITPLADRGDSASTEPPTGLIELGAGEVLVGDHSASQIFDADTGSFRPFPDPTARIPWVRRLDDGRFLIARARPFDDADSVADVQIYDHETGTFSDVADLELPLIGGRAVVSAALLPDNRLFVIRQPDRMGDPHPGAAVYDLDTGAVQDIGAPTGRRTWAQPIALPDGRILIVGNFGCNQGCEWQPDAATAELFAVGDPLLPGD